MGKMDWRHLEVINLVLDWIIDEHFNIYSWIILMASCHMQLCAESILIYIGSLYPIRSPDEENFVCPGLDYQVSLRK